MAGQPLKRACFAALDAHEEEVFVRLAAGEYVTTLCAEYLAEPYAEHSERDEPSNYYFYSWLDAADGRRDRFDRVREAAADAVAEESVRILDEAREEGVHSTAEATLARSQSSARQWWASKLNRAKYGAQKQGVDVNISVGELHLDALRQHCRREPLEGEDARAGLPGDSGEKGLGTLPGEPSDVVEAEWEEVEEELGPEDEFEVQEPEGEEAPKVSGGS